MLCTVFKRSEGLEALCMCVFKQTIETKNSHFFLYNLRLDNLFSVSVLRPIHSFEP